MSDPPVANASSTEQNRLAKLEDQMATALSLLENQRKDMTRVLTLLESRPVKVSPPPLGAPERKSITTPGELGLLSPLPSTRQQQKPAELSSSAIAAFGIHHMDGNPNKNDTVDKNPEKDPQGASFTKYINKLQSEVRRRTEYLNMMEHEQSHPTQSDRGGSRRMSKTGAVSYASETLDSVRQTWANGQLPKNGSSHWMISPASPWKIAWDLAIIMPVLVYLTIMMPFRLSFANEPVIGTGVWVWEFMIEMLFIADIFIHFRTGYFLLPLSRDESLSQIPVEYDRSLVARKYLKTWFFLDLLSGIPFMVFDYALEVSNGVNALKVVKSMRLLRVLKLMRLWKVESMFGSMDRELVDWIEDFVADKQTQSVVMAISLSLKTLYVVHIFACVWVYIGRVGSKKGLDNWLAHEVKGPFEAHDTEGGRRVYSIYLASHYYVMTTMSSVGYGDVLSRNNTERTFSIFLELIGAFVFAIIIAALTASVTSMDMNARRANKQLEAVASFVQNRKFPTALSRRIRRHFRQFYEHKAAINEAKIFDEMSSSLRMEVSAYIVNVQMSDVKIFQTMNPMLWSSLISILKPTRFQQGETVSRQGEECSEMYLVLHGDLIGVTFVDGKTMPRERFISPGDSINVLCVLKVWNQCVETVVCSRRPGTHIECYAVSATDFYGLFQHDDAMDRHVFREMQRVECRNYKMDLEDPLAPTRWGVPLYLTFSVVAVTVVGAKNIVGNDFNGSCDPYAVVELVDSDTLKPVDGNRTYHHRTVTVPRSSSPAWQSKVKWRYVSQRFERLSIKVTLFDEDTFSRDDPLGMVVLPLVDVEKLVLHPHQRTVTKKWKKGFAGVKVGVNLAATREEAERMVEMQFQQAEQEEAADTAAAKNGFGDIEGARERFLERHSGDPERDIRYASRLALDKDASKEESGSVETWYDLKPCPGGPAKVSGQIRLRTWAKRSDGDHNDLRRTLKQVTTAPVMLTQSMYNSAMDRAQAAEPQEQQQQQQAQQQQAQQQQQQQQGSPWGLPLLDPLEVEASSSPSSSLEHEEV